MTIVGADKSYNLTQLNQWVAQEEQIIGPITEIDDGGACTAAGFDEQQSCPDDDKLARIYLSVGGQAVAPPGKTIVCQGRAYVSGVLMEVFAVR